MTKRVRRNKPRKRTAPPTERKIFKVSEKTLEFAKALAHFHKEDRRDQTIIRQCLREVGISSNPQQALHYKQNEKVQLLATYIRKDWPYKAITRNCPSRHAGVGVLTAIQEEYCYRYVNSPKSSISRAAEQVGVTYYTARGWMEDDAVKDHIKKLKKDRERKYKIETEEIRRQYWNIATSNPRDYLEAFLPDGTPIWKDITTMTDDQLAALQEIKIVITETGPTKRTQQTLKNANKIQALNALARSSGMWDVGSNVDPREMALQMREWANALEDSDAIPGGEL
jgi:hypothetical protein